MAQDVAQKVSLGFYYTHPFWEKDYREHCGWQCLICDFRADDCDVDMDYWMRGHLEQEHLLSPVFIGFSSMYVLQPPA